MYPRHIVLDFEMNPVSKENQSLDIHFWREVIEIGAVNLDEQGKKIPEFKSL